MINFFLEEENKVHKEELVSLVKLDTPEADIKILVRTLLPFSLLLVLIARLSQTVSRQ
jgi:hypothetical protein